MHSRSNNVTYPARGMRQGMWQGMKQGMRQRRRQGTPGFHIKELHIKKLRGWISVKKRNFLTRGGGLEKHISKK